ncbi:MAG: NUMOD4 domain-containing protein [Methanoregula sp.]|jgi:hypothetical protein
MTCNECGGMMIGDGVTEPVRCENAEGWEDHEPDCNPIDCIISIEEVWKDIPGYEGIYQVSNTGKIKSLYGARGKLRKGPGGKILVPMTQRDRYPHVTLCKNGKGKHFTVHRLVALTFLGPRPEGQEIMHIDGNRKNPESTNLRYGSKSCNMAFTVDHGTNKVNGRKLDGYKANRIREYLSVGITVSELARHFAVSRTTILNIRKGKNYKTTGGENAE